MKERLLKFQIGVIVGLAIAGISLFAFILFWENIYPLPYQTVQPAVQPSTSSPADLSELTTRVTSLEQNQTYNFQTLEWKLDQKLIILGWISLFISFLAGAIGIKSYNDLDKIIKDKVGEKLDKALYQLDPTNLSIFVPDLTNTNDKKEMEKVWNRLDLTGLENLNWYRGFESGRVNRLFEGVTIVLLKNETDENTFTAFLKRYKKQLNPKRAAFILYAKDNYKVKSSTFELYENLITANMPATVANMVLVVGRGLREKEEK